MSNDEYRMSKGGNARAVQALCAACRLVFLKRQNSFTRHLLLVTRYSLILEFLFRSDWLPFSRNQVFSKKTAGVSRRQPAKNADHIKHLDTPIRFLLVFNKKNGNLELIYWMVS